MTLQELIKTLQQIALTQPNVRTATDGDIYEVMDGNPSVRYGVFHITQNTHQSYEDRDVYGLNLFYVDRNEDDNANTLQIQSIGKNVIDNIIITFCEEYDGEYPTITYTPFTQRFKDNTAGVFASLQMEVFKDWTCSDGYGAVISKIVIRNQTKTVDIDAVGQYTVVPDEDYSGLGKVIINCDIPIQPVKEVTLVGSMEHTILPDEGYTSMSEVVAVVEVHLEEKTVELDGEGYYEIQPNEGYEGMSKIDVTVRTGKPVVPNGIMLKNSTWSEFDMGPYDWSNVYNWSFMFINCRNLEKLLNFPDIKAYGSLYRMFDGCYKLQEIPYINTNKISDFRSMFKNCKTITTIPQIDMIDAVDASEMFYDCDNLYEIPLLDCRNLETANYIIRNCGNLEHVGGFKDIKCNFRIWWCTKLRRTSFENIVNNLYDFVYEGETPSATQGTLTLSENTGMDVNELASSYDDLIAIANNKGWKIVFTNSI